MLPLTSKAPAPRSALPGCQPQPTPASPPQLATRAPSHRRHPGGPIRPSGPLKWLPSHPQAHHSAALAWPPATVLLPLLLCCSRCCCAAVLLCCCAAVLLPLLWCCRCCAAVLLPLLCCCRCCAAAAAVLLPLLCCCRCCAAAAPAAPRRALPAGRKGRQTQTQRGLQRMGRDPTRWCLGKGRTSQALWTP
jgi:hypothetical protein